MSMTQEQIRGLDQLRQRLSQLSNSIATLRTDLERDEPLPTWPSLQSSAQALSFNMQQLMETFNGHRQFLREAHAYPLTNFPGHTQENLLGQLLRKKLEPRVEDWIGEYTTKENSATQVNGTAPAESELNKEELKELWGWAGETSNGIVRRMLEDEGAFQDDFTIAEREAGVENVVTGLRRKLDGDSEEEDEDDEEDEEMEDVMPSAKAQGKGKGEEEGVDPDLPPVPLDSVLKFMATGALPSNGPQR